MGDLGEMKVKVSADIKDLVKKLDDGGISLNEFGKRAKSISDKLGKDVKGGSNSAALALQNLGRVAQDAPYGFIGIANNINPLVESFQRLKAESGSTSTALKTMVSGLAGVGGVGLAVSLVTSLLVVFSSGMFSAKNSVDAASGSFEDFSNVIQDAKDRLEDFNTEADHLKKLGSINLNIGFKDGLQKDLLGLSEQSVLTSEGIVLLGDEIKNVSAASKQAFKSFTEKASTDAQKLYDTYGNVLRIPEDAVEGLSKSDKKLLKNAKDTQSELGKLQAKEKQALDARDIIYRQHTEKRVEDSRKETEANNKKAESEAKRLANLPTIAKELKTMEAELRFLNTKEISFKTDETKNKINTVTQTIETLFKKFGQNASSPVVLDLIAKVNGIKLEDWSKDILKGKNITPIELPFEIIFNNSSTNEDTLARAKNALEDQIGKGFGNKSESLQKGLNLFNESDFDDQKKKAFLLTQGVTTGLQDGLTTGIDALRFPQLNALYESTKAAFDNYKALNETLIIGLSESFGAAISGFATGAGALGSVFEGVLDLVGEYLIQLGKGAIKAALVAQALKNISKAGGPALGIIGGLAAIAAGSLLKNIKLPAFAGGVTNFSGGAALVGERGPEIVNLPRGSDVIPNNRIRESFGGGRQEIFIPNVTLRGQDLVLAFERSKRTIDRNG